MKNLIILFFVLLLFSCKTTKKQIQKDVDSSIRTEIKQDSTVISNEKESTTLTDNSNVVRYTYDEWFAEPDTAGVQHLVRTKETVTAKGQTKTMESLKTKIDSTKVNKQENDSTSFNVIVKEKTTEEVKNPFDFSKYIPFLLIIGGILLYIFRKNILQLILKII